MWSGRVILEYDPGTSLQTQGIISVVADFQQYLLYQATALFFLGIAFVTVAVRV